MNKKLKQYIKEENKYIDLLKGNPRFRQQGYSMRLKKVVVGVIQGNPKEYNKVKDTLDYKYFDTWKEAYLKLV